MILVDAHVHIYDCFDIVRFLDYAIANFKHEAQNQKIKDFSAFLLLTESNGSIWFPRLQEYICSKKQIGSWSFLSTNEQITLRASHKQEGDLFIVAGRQIVTAERLEVLDLATDNDFPDEQPLINTVAAVKSAGAIPVIPWASGKWMGKRGQILRDFLQFHRNKDFFLGDNGGRPIFWPAPTLFASAKVKGIKILPGSDPLPLPSEVYRVGSFGFIINRETDGTVSAEQLKQILHSEDCSISSYGRLLSPYSFFSNQLRIRLYASKMEPKSLS